MTPLREMPRKAWMRPLLAFAITFGVLMLLVIIARSVVAFQYMIALGPEAATNAANLEHMKHELGQLNRRYAPVGLAAMLLLSTLSAAIFAMWRPKPKMPPPLRGRGNDGAETR